MEIMVKDAFLLRLDQLTSSYLILLTLAGISLLAGILLYVGLIGWAVRLFGRFVEASIRLGFGIWERQFSWANWDLFLGVVAGCVWLGWIVSRHLPLATVACAFVPILMGVSACLAYMHIDQERYQVARGYKAVHNPTKGQELARQLVRYGQQVSLPMLISASIGVICGFALLNFGLYQSIGRTWYAVGAGQPPATFVDFLASALINLLRVVDVLDFANSTHILGMTYVRHAKWPAALLLTTFKMFFTLVLLQKLFASIRQGALLSETISDLWSPHEPIYERARHALPQYGPTVVGPLLTSLGSIVSLTKEQREQLPAILATIGPGSIPTLIAHLDDTPAHVRAIAIATLGHLHARSALSKIASFCRDPSDLVRLNLVDALGILGVPEDPVSVAAPELITEAVPVTHRGIWSRIRWKRRLQHGITADPIKLAVKTLQSALEDDLPSIRTQAARALGRIGLPAAASAFPLIGALQDEHEAVRLEATKSLARVGGPKRATVTALMERLDDISSLVRAAAARAMGTLREAASHAVPALISLLQDRDEAVRHNAAEAIGQMGILSESHEDELIAGLASPDNIVRAQTAEALGIVGKAAEKTISGLIDALADRNDMVRAKAAEAIGRIGVDAAKLAVPSLVRTLRDRDNSVSSLAAEALGRMGAWADGAIPQLTGSLQHINPQVRACAAHALGKKARSAVGARSALEIASRDDDIDVCCQALWAIGKIGLPTTSSRQTVLDCLQHADGLVRSAAVETIGWWNQPDPDLTDGILKLILDPNDQVKIQVARVLPKFAGATPQVIEALCGRLREDDSDLVQAHAAMALAELGPAAVAATETLIQMSQTGEVNVREQAIRAIAIILPPESLSVLVAGLRDPNSEIRTVASEGLAKVHPVPPEVVPELITALNDPEVRVRANAALALAHVQSVPEIAIPLLLACAEEPDENLRAMATLALKQANEEHAVDSPIEPALQ